MRLNGSEVLTCIRTWGVPRLYHANTVQTACLFLEQGGLLSRGAMKDRDLPQTPQSSDDHDQCVGVWYDIFLDTIDIHQRCGQRPNHYGPVLFEMDVELLLEQQLPPIMITRANPIHWKTLTPQEDRYLQSISEFEATAHEDPWENAITLRETKDFLPFSRWLRRVVLDNPLRNLDGQDLCEQAKTLLSGTMEKAGLDQSILAARACSSCALGVHYGSCFSEGDLRDRFLPVAINSRSGRWSRW